MFTKIIPLICCSLIFSFAAQASEDHGSSLFHAFTLEADAGENRDDPLRTWDLDGWIGSDDHKLWLKSEGEHINHQTDSSESWALYSLNVATFWDVQAGLRYDSKPESLSYAVLGFNGLAPYYFETEAHLFVSDEGDVSLRLRGKNDFLITQKLVLQPYAEANLFAQNVRELDTGSGLSDGNIGLHLRYEITRRFAPYLDLRYEKLFGETADIARGNGERRSNVTGTFGLRLMF